MNPTPDPALLDRLCALFHELPRNAAALDQLLALYDEDVIFQDPIQTVRGKPEFRDMNLRLLRRARAIHFEVTDRAQRGDSLFLVWTMTLVPRIGPPLQFEGSSHLRTRAGLIYYHRDFWDLLGSFMASVPVAGNVYRSLVRRLG